MHVGVIEAGHNEATAEIHDLRLWPLQLHDLVARSHGEDAVAANRQHLGALARSQRSGRIDYSGVDVAVGKDQVRFRLLSVLNVLSTLRLDAVLRLDSPGRGQQ